MRLRFRVLQYYIPSVILEKPDISRGKRRVLEIALQRRAQQRTHLIHQRELVEAAVPRVPAETTEAEDDDVPDRPVQRRERGLDGAQERRSSELGALCGERALRGGRPDGVVAWRSWGFCGEVAGWVPQWGPPFADDVAPAVGRGDDIAA